jgi:hypothetical protein
MAAYVNPAAFSPRTAKVWLGERYAADVALRGHAFDAAVKSRAQLAGSEAIPFWIVERQWLNQCRLRFPPRQLHNNSSGADPP